MTAVLRQNIEDCITTAREVLVGPRSRVDGIFVEAGTELIASVESLRRVTQLFGSIPSTIEGEDLRKAVGIIQDVSARTAAIANDMSGGSGELGQLLEALNRASDPIDKLLRVMKTMGIVSINARVAAASLGNSTVDIGIFWQDLGELAKSANAVVTKISLQYETLARSLASAALARVRFLNAQRQPLRHISRSLNERLASIEQLRSLALKSSVETEQAARNIADRVAAIIASMQSGDAARQRMDHIDSALAKLTEETLPDNVISLTVALQSRQLEAARQELDQETASAIDAVSGIESDLRSLQQRAGVAALNNGDNSALAALETAVRQSAEALRRCEADRKTFDDMAQNVVKTVSELLSLATELEALEHQTRLVSLNATIRCAHLGDRGRALSVIAQQLRELTEETSTASTAAVAALRSAGELSEQLSARDAGKPSLATGQLEVEINDALGALIRLGQSLTDANAELQRETPLVRSRLGAVIKLLTNCQELVGELDGAADALTVDVPPDNDGAVSHKDFFVSLRKAYSVEVERQIHDELVGNDPEPPAPPSAEADDLDAMLF